MKRNKIRYQSRTKPRIAIVITGQVYLQYADDEAIGKARKGDLLVYPYNEALNTTRQGDYGCTGFAGYFKVDVHDGAGWRPVLINEIFLKREHHFAKSECPIDTYALCAETLCALSGRSMRRTYREHYQLEMEERLSS